MFRSLLLLLLLLLHRSIIDTVSGGSRTLSIQVMAAPGPTKNTKKGPPRRSCSVIARVQAGDEPKKDQ